MPRSPRIRVVVGCVADHYADKTKERIIEFIDPQTGLSGLIQFERRPTGGLRVAVYNADPGVVVTASARRQREGKSDGL